MKKDNLAYDFKRFETNPIEEKQPHIKKIPKTKKVQKSNYNSLVVFIIVGFILCFGMVFLKVQINETTSQIQNQTKMLNELKSDEIRLKMNIESNVSLNNIEKQAKEELGLNKIETSQIEYVNIEKDSENITVNKNRTLWDDIKDFFNNIFS